MKWRIFLIIIIAIIAIFCLFFLFPKNIESKQLTLILDYGNNYQRTFRVSLSSEKSAWSLLQQAAALSKIDLEPTNDFFPKKIENMVDGAGNKHWVFYVNGIKQNLSPLDTVVNPPAEVVFRFE